jgi:hypothetical protein
VPVLFVHLPHLVLALAALGVAARVEGVGHRVTPLALGVGALLAAATILMALPVLRGEHPAPAVVALYLVAGALAGARAGWVAAGRVGGRGAAAALAGTAVGAGLALGYLVAGVAMTHGALFSG